MEATNIVVVIVVVIVVFILLSACCRGIRHAYEDHLTNEELVRRRQAFYITQASRNLQHLDETRAVRVTTISRDGDRVALGVYEITVPHRAQNRSALDSSYSLRSQPPPPPFSTAMQVSSPITYIDVDDLQPPPSYQEYLKMQPPNEDDAQVQPPDDKQRY